jgi:hypothetical protein
MPNQEASPEKKGPKFVDLERAEKAAESGMFVDKKDELVIYHARGLEERSVHSQISRIPAEQGRGQGVGLMRIFTKIHQVYDRLRERKEASADRMRQEREHHIEQALDRLSGVPTQHVLDEAPHTRWKRQLAVERDTKPWGHVGDP